MSTSTVYLCLWVASLSTLHSLDRRAPANHPSLIQFCNETRDPLIPAVWGELKKGEDPYAPVEQGCCLGKSRWRSRTRNWELGTAHRDWDSGFCSGFLYSESHAAALFASHTSPSPCRPVLSPRCGCAHIPNSLFSILTISHVDRAQPLYCPVRHPGIPASRILSYTNSPERHPTRLYYNALHVHYYY